MEAEYEMHDILEKIYYVEVFETSLRVNLIVAVLIDILSFHKLAALLILFALYRLFVYFRVRKSVYNYFQKWEKPYVYNLNR